MNKEKTASLKSIIEIFADFWGFDYQNIFFKSMLFSIFWQTAACLIHDMEHHS